MFCLNWLIFGQVCVEAGYRTSCEFHGGQETPLVSDLTDGVSSCWHKLSNDCSKLVCWSVSVESVLYYIHVGFTLNQVAWPVVWSNCFRSRSTKRNLPIFSISLNLKNRISPIMLDPDPS